MQNLATNLVVAATQPNIVLLDVNFDKSITGLLFLLI